MNDNNFPATGGRGSDVPDVNEYLQIRLDQPLKVHPRLLPAVDNLARGASTLRPPCHVNAVPTETAWNAAMNRFDTTTGLRRSRTVAADTTL